MSTLVGAFIDDLDESGAAAVDRTPPVDASRRLAPREELQRLTALLRDKTFCDHVTLTQQLQSDEEFELDEDQFLVATNDFLLQIDDDSQKIHSLLVRVYRKKFPGLETQIKDVLTYSKVVRVVANSEDISSVDLTGILPSKTILIVRLAFANCNGEQLTPAELSVTLDCVQHLFRLSELRGLFLEYISSKMRSVAPNLSAVVGAKIAAQLVGIAGGLEELSSLPASTIILLGRKKRDLHGLSSASLKVGRFAGLIAETDIVLQTDPDFRKRAARYVANKCVLAVRADRFGREDGDDSVGKKLRAHVLRSLGRVQEPPPPIQEKPLPAPDYYEQRRRRNRRGGKKARRLKAIYGMTETRKKMNRMEFGVQQVEDFETGQGYGLLGVQSGSNTMRLTGKTKMKANRRLKKRLEQDMRGRSTVPAFYGGSTTSGLSSSLVFTPVQGIELVNPLHLQAVASRKRKSRYFDDGGFRKPKRRKVSRESSGSKGQ